jgi:predicted dehydrogenase
MDRRRFVQTLGAAALAAPFVTRDLQASPPGTILRHASCGASGMAWADIQAICHNPFVQLVAVAEVDATRLTEVRTAFPDVKVYADWREMFDREAKNIDSVNISTPDHTHAPMALAAMQLGKHVYCQKPLTHSVHESRVLTEYARGRPLVTQMGIQVHTQKAYRQAVALVQGGAIGKIRQVHTWSNKSWGDTGAPPVTGEPVPAGLDWDLWLGGCAARPYVGGEYYHPGNWRKRLDFGTGTFGDMGCHIFDPVFEALALTAPLSLRSDGPAPDAWNWATNACIRYIFPGTAFTEGTTVPVTWYDGAQRPPAEVMALISSPPGAASDDAAARGEAARLLDQGSVFIGTHGVMHLPHVATPRLLPAEAFKDYPMPEITTSHHWTDWAQACIGGPAKPSAPFSYSGPLTETVLLGSVAVRFPGATLAWDAARLRFTNERKANAFLRRKYRRGWKIDGL